MFRLRRSPCSTSCVFLPRALPVPGKSKAIRGGLAMVKPAGGLASGCLSPMRTTILPLCCPTTLMDSMLFAVAGAGDWALACIVAAMPSASIQTRPRAIPNAVFVLFMCCLLICRPDPRIAPRSRRTELFTRLIDQSQRADPLRPVAGAVLYDFLEFDGRFRHLRDEA